MEKEKRTKNSNTTREAILNAAEAIFSEFGFNGARTEAIAQISGYNQALIFRYFGDKLGLYAEVLTRIDREVTELITQQLEPLLDDRIVTDARLLRAYFINVIGMIYDFIVAHPQFMRMMIWEHAENWQTYSKLTSMFENEHRQQLETQLFKAQKAGVIRADCDPINLFMLAEQICWFYPSSIPYYQIILPERDFSSIEKQAFLRQQIINFIVSGILIDPLDDPR